MNNELLYNKIYEKTKDCGRSQFIKLIMAKERENEELKERIKGYEQERNNLINSVPFKENQELKKQLENTDYTSVYLKACEDTKDKYESQQKEFIEYLNWMFNYYQKEEQKYRTLSNRAMKVAFESVLEKYKEIIGGDNK